MMQWADHMPTYSVQLMPCSALLVITGPRCVNKSCCPLPSPNTRSNVKAWGVLPLSAPPGCGV